MHLTKATTVTLFSFTFKKMKKERRSHADPETRRPLAAQYLHRGSTPARNIVNILSCPE